MRTYSVAGTLADVPALAEKHDINVAIGAWLDSHRDKNEEQLQTAIGLAKLAHQRRARAHRQRSAAARRPADRGAREGPGPRPRRHRPAGEHGGDLWHVWLAHPELAAHVDFIGCTCCRTGRGSLSTTAVDYSLTQYKRLQKAFPHKPIVVAEIGWPSRGRTHESAVRYGCQRGAVPAPLSAARREGADRLLRDGGLRSALEGVPGGRGRFVLGRVRRQPAAEVRLHRAHRAGAGVAHPRRRVGGGGAAGARTRVSVQRHAAQPRPQLPRHRGVRRRDHRGVGVLRLHAAVHDGVERHRRRAAAARDAGCHAGAARRGA